MAGRSLRMAGLICALALGENACSDPGEPGNPAVVPVQAVRVTPQVIVFSAIGETAQLSATVIPAEATDQAIIWESADSTVARVDAFGRVTARAVGSGVFVTAYTRDGRFQASVNVSVNP